MSSTVGDIRQRIQDLKKTRPFTDDVTIIAVTKYASLDEMKALYDLGFRNFGENKAQDLERKCRYFEGLDIQWHFIGHLQTNKVKKVLPLVSMIQSVDSLKLLKKINDEAAKLGKKMPVLLQVNIAKETSKGGFEEDELLSYLPEESRPKKELTQCANIPLTNVEVQGIMVLAPVTTKESLMFCFNKSRALFNSISNKFDGIKVLSMGMSQDFETAIAEGSTMVRLGSVLMELVREEKS